VKKCAKTVIKNKKSSLSFEKNEKNRQNRGKKKKTAAKRFIFAAIFYIIK